ncbi:hypothetical protein AXF15_07080 [Desulfomicrobium orale DSM 12838]|uniref:histidine kinase n=2 Tax=Desulfomicrobium orale TaxID=132132 RepID=A0A0X8JQA3_9BACT|nr:hypothetical protein AXF15_07080 [Desulfomicrobium orale DSM 12838]
MHIITEQDANLYNLVQKSIFIMCGLDIVYYNRCFTDVSGIQKMGLKNISILDFISEKDIIPIKEYVKKIEHTEYLSCLTNKVQIKLLNKLSKEYITEISMIKISYLGKESYLCTLNDITEFFISSRKLKRILNAIPDVVIEFDKNHDKIKAANSAIEGVYGIPDEQFTQNIFHPIDLVYEEDKEYVKSFYNNLLDEEYGKIEYRIISANGLIKWVRDEGEVVYKDYGNGEVLKVYHFIRDITERKKNIEQLKVSEKKYRKIFEHSTDPIFVSDSDGAFIDINNAALRLFGFSEKKDALLKNVHEIYADPQKRDIMMGLLKEKGSLSDYPMQIKTHRGDIIDVTVTIGCRKNIRTGKIKSIQTIIHDITDVIKKTEIESYRRTLGGIADRINNITQSQIMHYGLIYEYIESFENASIDEKNNIINDIIDVLNDSKRVVYDLKDLGAAIRRIYHNPEPPKAVSDGLGGVLFDLHLDE